MVGCRYGMKQEQTLLPAFPFPQHRAFRNRGCGINFPTIWNITTISSLDLLLLFLLYTHQVLTKKMPERCPWSVEMVHRWCQGLKGLKSHPKPEATSQTSTKKTRAKDWCFFHHVHILYISISYISIYHTGCIPLVITTPPHLHPLSSLGHTPPYQCLVDPRYRLKLPSYFFASPSWDIFNSPIKMVRKSQSAFDKIVQVMTKSYQNHLWEM